MKLWPLSADELESKPLEGGLYRGFYGGLLEGVMKEGYQEFISFLKVCGLSSSRVQRRCKELQRPHGGFLPKVSTFASSDVPHIPACDCCSSARVQVLEWPYGLSFNYRPPE